MRLTTVPVVAAICLLCCLASPASAGVKVLIATRTYDITGASGEALIASMNRNGPMNGFMTRAVAQTSYTKDWEFDFVRTRGACRIRQSNGTLNLTFTYPRLVGTIPAALQKHWKRFLKGVVTHERTHGRIAREMMVATEKALTGLTVPDDAQCLNIQREAKRLVDTIYAEYEDKQNAFDVREHREGGHVEYLLDTLERP